MTPDQRLRELAIRHAAFAWLDRQRAAGKEVFTQADTSGLHLAGESIRLMPTQQGIWKPAQLAAALSIRTVYRPPARSAPTTTRRVQTDFSATRCAAAIRIIMRTAPCAWPRIIDSR